MSYVNNSISGDKINNFFLQSVLYLSSFAGTLNMEILCFRNVEHPKIAQFVPGIKNQIFYNIKNRQHRSSHRRCSVKKGVLRNFAKFTGKHLCQRLFCNSLQPYLKIVSGTDVLLWILRNFWEHFFYRTPPDNCFWQQ